MKKKTIEFHSHSTEYLNHVITILQRDFVMEAHIFDIDGHPRSLANAIILCISREIEIQMRGLSEEDMHKERLHNCEALAKGLGITNAIIFRG